MLTMSLEEAPAPAAGLLLHAAMGGLAGVIVRYRHGRPSGAR